jgi:hypothetical protein
MGQQLGESCRATQVVLPRYSTKLILTLSLSPSSESGTPSSSVRSTNGPVAGCHCAPELTSALSWLSWPSKPIATPLMSSQTLCGHYQRRGQRAWSSGFKDSPRNGVRLASGWV